MIDFGEALHDHLEHFGRDRINLVNAAKLLGYITNVHNAHQDYLSKSTENRYDNADAVQKKDSIKAAKLKLSRLQESPFNYGRLTVKSPKVDPARSSGRKSYKPCLL